MLSLYRTSMNRCPFRSILTSLIFIISTYAGIAQDSAHVSTKNNWFGNMSMNVFLSAGYSYNLNNPDSRKNQFRIFDFDDNSIKVDVVEIVLKRDANNFNDVGFRMDLTAGSSIPKVARSGGLNIGDLDFHQMYLSYIAAVGNGLRLDFGKFVTHMGYELIDGYDGYNDNQTRSFLFGYTIPYTHTGVRIGYSFVENISAMLMIVNGWDNAIDNNKSKTVCGQIAITPTNGLNLFANMSYGPEKDNNNSDNRSAFDFVGVYAVNDLLTLGTNIDYGSEPRATTTGTDASWFGFAGYLRFNISKCFSLALRGEQFDDKEGVRTGTIQKLREVTITPEFKPADHFSVRGDFRMDKSDKKVFEKGIDLTDTQTTVGVSVLYYF